jgi:predicted NAD-dependent protein-ADP-ribosyltransferase YbiA (DUF1768 family)
VSRVRRSDGDHDGPPWQIGLRGEEMMAPKQWTAADEERLRELLLQNETPSEIANALGRSASSVKSKAHALGMTIARLGKRNRGSLSKWG